MRHTGIEGLNAASTIIVWNWPRVARCARWRWCGMVMQAGVQSDRQPGAAPVADIDLGALRHALWRKKFLILGLTLLTAAIAFAGVNLVTPRYKSEARVLIEMRENIFFRPDAEKTADRSTTVDQEAVTSQVR